VVVNNEGITVRPNTIAGSSVLVYMSIPQGTEISVQKDGRVIAQAAVDSSLLIQDGRIIPVRVGGRQNLLSRLMLGSQPNNASDIQRLRTGEYMPGTATLKAHLASWSEPAAARTLTAANMRVASASLELRIDETGTVVDIRARSGAEDILRVYEQSLRSWKFRPFLVDGKAVAVKALVPFFVASDGYIRTPLDPSIFVDSTSPAQASARANSTAGCCQK